jgi:hypothetical protein
MTDQPSELTQDDIKRLCLVCDQLGEIVYCVSLILQEPKAARGLFAEIRRAARAIHAGTMPPRVLGVGSGYVRNSVTRAPRIQNPFYDKCLGALAHRPPTGSHRVLLSTFISVSGNDLAGGRRKQACFQRDKGPILVVQKGEPCWTRVPRSL